MISQVTIRLLQNGQPRDVWFLFETDHDDLFELNEDLATDGTVYGMRIETQPGPDGARRETSRYEYIVSRDAIVSISPPIHRLLPPLEAEVIGK